MNTIPIVLLFSGGTTEVPNEGTSKESRSPDLEGTDRTPDGKFSDCWYENVKVGKM